MAFCQTKVQINKQQYWMLFCGVDGSLTIVDDFTFVKKCLSTALIIFIVIK